MGGLVQAHELEAVVGDAALVDVALAELGTDLDGLEFLAEHDRDVRQRW